MYHDSNLRNNKTKKRSINMLNYLINFLTPKLAYNVSCSHVKAHTRIRTHIHHRR